MCNGDWSRACRDRIPTGYRLPEWRTPYDPQFRQILCNSAGELDGGGSALVAANSRPAPTATFGIAGSMDRPGRGRIAISVEKVETNRKNRTLTSFIPSRVHQQPRAEYRSGGKSPLHNLRKSAGR